jgi:hypothetical protein
VHLNCSRLLGTAALLALLGIGTTVHAEEPLDSMAPARFSATLVEESDGVLTLEASDPRISGTWTGDTGPGVAVATEDGTGEVIGVWSNAVRVDNADGSWVGHGEGFGHAAGFRQAMSAEGDAVSLVGEGAYAGLTATLLSVAGQDREPGTGPGSFEGVIVPVGWLPVAEPSPGP